MTSPSRVLPQQFKESVAAQIDLDLVKINLTDPVEGPGWSEERADRVEQLYRKWLHLVALFPDERIVPTKDVDTFWHHHILDTRAYFADTEQIFGHYLHHFPYFGIRDENDREELQQAYCRTQELYSQTFDEQMSDLDQSRCSCCGAEGPKCCSETRRPYMRPQVTEVRAFRTRAS